MTISFSTSGDFKNTEKFLLAMQQQEMFNRIDAVCKKGVEALRVATPVDQGTTAASWDYEIKKSRGGVKITWTNSHVNNGAPIAILLQYGHATGTGGWVPGRDYINPAMRPIFQEITDQVWDIIKSS